MTRCPAAIYKDFNLVTEASLKQALTENSASLSANDTQAVMRAYDSLAVFADAVPALETLKTSPALDAFVFSNGIQTMLSASVNKSRSFAPFAQVIKGLVSVDDVKVFKPDPRCYQHLQDTVRRDAAAIWLVSANPFDVVGAKKAGLNAVWVDRKGKGWTDALAQLVEGEPNVVVRRVDEAIREIKRLTKAE